MWSLAGALASLARDEEPDDHQPHDCGLQRMSDEQLNKRFHTESGEWSDVEFHAFTDPRKNVRTQMERVRSHPWLDFIEVRGFIYDVKTGILEEVTPD